MAEKRKSMQFREVESLAFSFRELIRIENLLGFDSLVRLKLDCNNIQKIEHVGHLVRNLILQGCISVEVSSPILCACPERGREQLHRNLSQFVACWCVHLYKSILYVRNVTRFMTEAIDVPYMWSWPCRPSSHGWICHSTRSRRSKVWTLSPISRIYHCKTT